MIQSVFPRTEAHTGVIYSSSHEGFEKDGAVFDSHAESHELSNGLRLQTVQCLALQRLD